MKTQKDKIIEILKDLIPPPKTWLGHPEDRIPVWESRINRAVTRILSELPEQPAMSEDKIHNLAYEYTLYTESWEIKQEAFIAGFKAALSQTKKK